MGEFDPTQWPKFIELPGCSRAWSALGLDDGDLTALQTAILNGPERHPVVSGTGGLRKIRFVRPGGGRGKSGGYRVCYACFLVDGVVILAMVYGKNEQADLTAAQRKDIAAALRAIGGQLKGEVR
jgi:mRNA-degrading endonuclease RelE of RelBE toxin-antitoxin system